MKIDNIISEWTECRNTIGRFDTYLLKLRLLGFSIFTLLFTTITGFAGAEKKSAIVSYETILFSIIILIIFILAIYILDRYYERMLLITVYRASYLEAYKLEEFKLGLTTEIEFQKEQLNSNSEKTSFLKASSMVNLVYVFIIIALLIEFYWISNKLENSYYNILLIAITFVIVAISYSANLLLVEPSKLINLRSKIIQSPIVMSKNEINYAVKKIALDIREWMNNEGIEKINVISILSGARPFTRDLISIFESLNIQYEIHTIKINSTIDLNRSNKNEILFGSLSSVLESKDVLIVDDLLDSGSTIETVKNSLLNFNAKNIKSAVLINKYKINNHIADFIGFNLNLEEYLLREKAVSDYWLFGYGMDLYGQYRDLEYIGWITKHIDNKSTR